MIYFFGGRLLSAERSLFLNIPKYGGRLWSTYPKIWWRVMIYLSQKTCRKIVFFVLLMVEGYDLPPFYGLRLWSISFFQFVFVLFSSRFLSVSSYYRLVLLFFFFFFLFFFFFFFFFLFFCFFLSRLLLCSPIIALFLLVLVLISRLLFFFLFFLLLLALWSRRQEEK